MEQNETKTIKLICERDLPYHVFLFWFIIAQSDWIENNRSANTSKIVHGSTPPISVSSLPELWLMSISGERWWKTSENFEVYGGIIIWMSWIVDGGPIQKKWSLRITYYFLMIVLKINCSHQLISPLWNVQNGCKYIIWIFRNI